MHSSRRIELYNAGRRPVRLARGTKVSRAIQLSVYRDIYEAMRPMIEDVDNLSEWLELVATPAQAKRALQELQEKWRKIYGNKSASFARRWVDAVSADQRKLFQQRMARTLGVDYTTVFDAQVVQDAAELMSVEASTFIQLIPDKYFEDIQEKVLLNYQQLPLPDGLSLRQYIEHTYHLADWEAKRLARDQTSKINTAVTQARNEEIGLEEYIWRTTGDSRVVGTPGGLYVKPNKLHGNHYERNGKKFRWDSPPPDGHPGWPINCRCWADPVVEIAKLKNVEWGMAA